MRIGIIGAGRVGVTMGKYLGDAGVEVTGFYSKTTQSAVQAAEFTDTTVYKTLQDIVEASDTLMITTPDGVIRNASAPPSARHRADTFPDLFTFRRWVFMDRAVSIMRLRSTSVSTGNSV